MSDALATRMSLQGRTAVVTGARGGIGSAICMALSAAGADVIAVDRLSGTEKLDHEARYEAVDITDEGSIEALASKLASENCKVHILVNNAGAMLGKALLETSLAELANLFAINVGGALSMMRAMKPLLVPTASIINMSSAAAAKPLKGMAAYSASKAALSVLSRVAAAELAPIRVNSVLPGAVDTPMPRAFVSNLPAGEQAMAIEALKESRMMKRLAGADEIADLVLYLASDVSSFITGTDVLIDGGRL
ncbi:3-alpha-(Or 20-beta)-hydroxysteroid dehydrogenase [Hyphomicrobiales bacterium]|nr:3-alpha-(Or 20-beta)-hydroxysteroid dehydrogenase [Hyphomicrobiales bacterium]CAH1675659.1 3-alpha-(Or 20-beta)-hydroxysteroid dehydrogenase [Hyphomicrobiales bacterium]